MAPAFRAGSRRSRASPASSPTSCSSAAAPSRRSASLLDAGDHERATHDDDGAQRVDHRHRRAADPAQPARPPRPIAEREPAAAAAARRGHRDAVGRVDEAAPTSTGPSTLADAGDPWCAGGSRSRRRGPGWPRADARKRCASPSTTLVELGDGEKAGRTPAPTRCSPSAPRRRMRARTCSGPPRATGSRPRRGRGAASSPGRGPAGATSPSACSSRSAATTRRWPSSASCSRSPDLSDAERSMTMLFEGFVLLNANRLEQRRVALRARRRPRLRPRQPAARSPRRRGVGRSSRRAAATCPTTLRWIATAENTALSEADDVLGVPFLCDMATMLGALGELELAERYLARAIERALGVPGPGAARRRSCSTPARASSATSTTALRVHAARRVVAGQARRRPTPPPVDGDAGRRAATVRGRAARARRARVQRLRVARRGPDRTRSCTRCCSGTAQPVSASPWTHRRAGAPHGSAGATPRLASWASRSTVHDAATRRRRPAAATRSGSSGVIVANGGSVTFDQLSEAIWPGEDVETQPDPAAQRAAAAAPGRRRRRRAHGVRACAWRRTSRATCYDFERLGRRRPRRRPGRSRARRPAGRRGRRRRRRHRCSSTSSTTTGR